MSRHLRYALLLQAHQRAATGLEQHRRPTVLEEALYLVSGVHGLRTAAAISQLLAPTLQAFLGLEESLIISANGTALGLHRPLGRDLTCLQVGKSLRHRATVSRKLPSFVVVAQLPRRRTVGCQNLSQRGLPMMETLKLREFHVCERAKVELKICFVGFEFVWRP